MRLILAFVTTILLAVNVAAAAPIIRATEQAFGTLNYGCLPDSAPHLSIDCVLPILLPSEAPGFGHLRANAFAEGQVGTSGLELRLSTQLSAIAPYIRASPGGPFATPDIRASVSFFDSLAVFTPLLPTGAPVITNLGFTVSGEVCFFACDGPPVALPVIWAPPHVLGTVSVGRPEREEFTAHNFQGPTTFTASVSALNGVPFDLSILASLMLTTDIDTAFQSFSFPEHTFWETSMTANFANTLRITGAEGVDASGNPIGAVSVRSSDGQSLVTPRVSVPEAPLIALYGTGLIILLTLGERRRRASPRACDKAIRGAA